MQQVLPSVHFSCLTDRCCSFLFGKCNKKEFIKMFIKSFYKMVGTRKLCSQLFSPVVFPPAHLTLRGWPSWIKRTLLCVPLNCGFKTAFLTSKTVFKLISHFTLQELSEKSILPQGYPSLSISILIKAGHGLVFCLQWNRLKSFQTGPDYLIRTSFCQISFPPSLSPSLFSLLVVFHFCDSLLPR